MVIKPNIHQVARAHIGTYARNSGHEITYNDAGFNRHTQANIIDKKTIHEKMKGLNDHKRTLGNY